MPLWQTFGQQNNNIFLIFDNNKTLDENIFLQSFKYEYLNDKLPNIFIKHIHFILMSICFINEIKQVNHIYIHGIFVFPNYFKQVIIIIYQKFRGFFIIMNNKT